MALPSPWRQVGGSAVSESGQAWVYQVRADDAERTFALKRLKNLKRRDRFEREVQTMQELANSGLPVPAIVSSDLRCERPWFVMPWYSGGSLQDTIDSGVIPLEERLRLVKTTADALASLHFAKVAHRDIKPANVLIDGNRILLADFGLCLSIEDDTRLTHADEAVGSRLYIAPENESGLSEEVDQRPADCYAWAKTTWAVIAARNPPARELLLQPENRLEILLSDHRLSGFHPLFERTLDSDPRARLTNWEIICAEALAVRKLYGPTSNRGDRPAVDLAPALSAAVRFAAREETRNARRERQRMEMLQHQVTELTEGLFPRFDRLLRRDFQQLDEAAGDDISFELSTGGVPFATCLNFNLLSEWRTRDIDSFSLSRQSPALAVVACRAEIPNKSTLYVATYPVLADNSLWLVRVPIMYRPPNFEPLIPDFLGWIYSSTGPLPLGLENTRAAVNDFVEVTAEIVKATAARHLELLANGRDIFSAESWIH